MKANTASLVPEPISRAVSAAVLRVRGTFRDTSLSVAAATGLVLSFVVVPFVRSAVDGIVMPVILRALRADGSPRHVDLTVADVTLTFEHTLRDALVLGFVLLVVYFLFVRGATRADESGNPLHPCPQCLRRVPIGASRCSYCTSEIGGIV